MARDRITIIRRPITGERIAQAWSITILGLCGVLPLGWVCWTLWGTPGVWNAGIVDAFRAKVLAKTLLYNGTVGVLATLMAIPAALALGRGSLWVRRILWAILPAGLLVPSLAYGYAWSQFFRLVREPLLSAGISFEPGSAADIARCIWTLAAWLWPIPAIIVGLHLRRMDGTVQLHAAADGVLWRMTLRQLLSPMVAGFAVVTLLASQEFAIYEPTGISVIATEIRMVFDSGVFSNMVNSARGDVSPDQAARAATALATALPLLACTLALAALAAWLSRSDIASGEIAADDWPRALRPPVWITCVAIVTILITAVLPVASLVLSLRIPFSPARIWAEFSEPLLGSMTVGAWTAGVGISLALAATIRRSRWTMGLLVVSFLIGGQLLAIACIRIWNRPGLEWMYDSWRVPALAYLARFSWIALAVAGGTWNRQWRELRLMAAVDGASRAQTAWHIIWPNLSPMLLAAALLIGALSMTEVPATVILQPQNPRVLTPMIMAWVHIMRFDPMIEAALLMMGVVLLLWIIAAVASLRRK